MAAIFPVTFIASNAANTIGLAGKGEVRLIAEDIELAVVKPWPVAARVGLFFVAVPVLWFLFGSLTSAISGVGGVWSWLRVFLWLFTVFGVPLCVLGLIGHYCVKGNVLDAPPRDVQRTQAV